MIDNPFMLGPVLLPLVGAVLSLLLAGNNRLQRYVGLLAAALAFSSALMLLAFNLEVGPQIYRLGGWDPPYGIVLVADKLSALFVTMAAAVMLGGVLYALHCRDKCVSYPTFIPLFLCMEAGLNGAFLTGDLFTLFVFIELMVLSSVTLVAISDDRLGLEAAIKYLLISGMGSLFLLIGIGALYASLGTLNMAHIGLLLSSGERPILTHAAAIMLMCAFLLKSAVFPFHFWQPDFHTTAPTPVGSMLSSVVVKVGIYGIIRMITLFFIEEAAIIQNWLLLLGIVGIFFGSLTAMRTYHGKRLLAYSTLGQIGFILVGLGWGTPLALAAAIIYTVNHAFIKSALLMVMGLVSSRTVEKTAGFDKINGIGKKIPALIGVLWFVGGMGLAGIPPLNGFISKLTLVQSGIDVQNWLPLGLAIGAGILSMLYVMRTWQSVFQMAPTEHTAAVKTEGDSPLAPLMLIGVCLFLGLNAQPLVEITRLIIVELGDPQIYINAVRLFGGG